MLADSRRKTWSVAAAVLAVLGGLAIALTFGLADSGASDPKPFRDAANARITGSDEAAATVNGRIIPMSKFEANAILRSSWLGGSLEAPGNSELLQIAIDNEILYQEAERLGLVPSDKEVVAEARMVKEMLLAGMKEDTEGAELFRGDAKAARRNPVSRRCLRHEPPKCWMRFADGSRRTRFVKLPLTMFLRASETTSTSVKRW